MERKKPTDQEIKEFKKELKNLLKKYNASIWVSLDGDTHGVSAEIVIDVNNTEVIREYDEIDYREINIEKLKKLGTIKINQK